MGLDQGFEAVQIPFSGDDLQYGADRSPVSIIRSGRKNRARLGSSGRSTLASPLL
jgi:hypothetical protein